MFIEINLSSTADHEISEVVINGTNFVSAEFKALWVGKES